MAVGGYGSGSNDEVSRLLCLPKELLHQILGYLTYDDISKNRQVCRVFEVACCSQLNRGFQHVERLLNQMQRDVRTKLPRRESERRNHSMARHADILSAIETRLSLLQITYSKYIESGYCCFIPGKVLDEMLRVLRYVRQEPSPRRSHEVLQELRDISSMAMEHFDEKILPGVKARMQAHGIAVLPGGFTVSIDERPVVIHGAHSPAMIHQAASVAAAATCPGESGCSKLGSSGLATGMTTTLLTPSSLSSPRPLSHGGRLPGTAPAIAVTTPPADCACSSAIGRLQASSGAHTAGLQSLRLDLGWLRNKLLDLERVCLRRERRAHRQELLVSEQARQLAQQHALITDLTARISQLESRGAPTDGAGAPCPMVSSGGVPDRGRTSNSSGGGSGSDGPAVQAAGRKRQLGSVGAAVEQGDDEAQELPLSKRPALAVAAAVSGSLGAGSPLPSSSVAASMAARTWKADVSHGGDSSVGCGVECLPEAEPSSATSSVDLGLTSNHVKPRPLVAKPRRLFGRPSLLNTRARAARPSATATAAAAAARCLADDKLDS